MLETDWGRVLGWRMGRHLLEPLGEGTVAELVSRLCGVQAQVASAAALAVAVRQAKPDTAAVEDALAKKELVRTWAMRGTLHLLKPEEAGAYLSLVAAGRTWEKASWVKTFGPPPDEMRELVEVVRDILDGQVLSRDELVDEIGKRLKRPALEKELRSGWGMVLKPIAWQGGLCHGPSQGNKVTFTRPDTFYPKWGGVPEPDEAAATVIPAYLRAYGPASPEIFDAYISRGVTKKAMVRGWFDDLGDKLATVEVEGEQLQMLADDVDDLAAARPSDTVRLLPAFDQWVLGPGTKATSVVPAEHRSDVSRKAGWISPVVILGGRVVGVWNPSDGGLDVRPFKTGMLTPAALDAEIARVGPLVSDP